MDRFTLSANTLSKTVKDNLADRIEVEIGDSKQRDFKPQFKIKRWDNEVNFSMRAQEEAGATMVEEDGKVKYKGRDIEVHQYEKPDAGEDGGYEFEWVLKKKPKSNVLRTTIQHKGLDFFYQPEINDAEAQAEMFKGDTRTLTEIKREMRPENVVGSYAVYHSTKRDNIVGGMEYKTGKAFHIYRPHAVDAKGVQVWCELDITEGELTVTVPEDFLNKASYPVVVDPTFGYTSLGSSATTNNTPPGAPAGLLVDISVMNSAPQSLTENDVKITEISLATRTNNSSSSEQRRAIAVNKSNDTVVAVGDIETHANRIAAAAFVNHTVQDANASIIQSGDYLLGYLGEDGRGTVWSFDTASGSFVFGNIFNYAAAMTISPGDVISKTATDRTGRDIYSLYATYTASSSYNPAFAHRRLLL